MKRFSKPLKVFAILLLSAIVIAIVISVVSYSIYGKVYVFDGYAYTRFLWLFVMSLGIAGAVGTLIFGIKDLVRMALGQPYTNNRSDSPRQITINEQMSKAAQTEFRKRLQAYNSSGSVANEQVEAVLFAQAVEMQLLKAPASAVFCSVGEMTYSFGNGIYTVNGYVDSQNSYGAMIRTPFTCTVLKKDGEWKSADYFVNTATTVATKATAHLAVYWIIGIIMALVSFGFFYFIIRLILG